MTSALPARFQAGSSPRWPAVAATELTMRLRDTNGPVFLACVAAACILLTPPANAGYAVITFGGLKPVMTAGTSIFAAGIVLSLLMFPVYALGLGVGCARDRRLGTGTLFTASPANPVAVLCGRLVANATLLIIFSLITLCLVVAVTGLRLRSLPDATSMAAYLLVVIPSGLCGVVVGAWMDRYLAESNSGKALVTITLWSVLMVCSVVAGPDVFGLRLLQQNAPGGPAGSEFAAGIIMADQMGKVPWATLALTQSFLFTSLYVLAAAITGVVPLLAWPGFLAALSSPPQRTTGGATSTVVGVLDLPRLQPRSCRPLPAALVIAQRWFRRGSWIRPLFAGALACAILAPRSPRISLSVALLVPLAVANANRLSGESYIRQFDLSTAAMWRPSPLVFTSLVLAAATLIPILPALAQLPAARSIHIAVAMVGMALWLTWTCAGLARPLLGISIYAALWYFESLGDLPAAADLLGFSGTSVTSFALAAVFTIAFSIMVLHRDLHASRSSRYI